MGSGSTRCIELYYCGAGRADSCSILPIGSVCVSVVTPLCVTHTLALGAPPEPSTDCRPGRGPPPSVSDNPSKTPCLEQKEPVVAVAYFSFEAFSLLSIPHSLFLSLSLSDSLKTISLFFMRSLGRRRKKHRLSCTRTD